MNQLEPKTADYLIIGGGIAGATAAEVLRQNNAEAKIIVVSEEPYPLYARIMLSKPNFFLEKIPFGEIWLKDERWYGQNKIELLAGEKAVRLDSEQKKIWLESGGEISFKKLLLAIGGCAGKIQKPGAEKSGVFYLRNLEDAKALMRAAKTGKKAVLVGGGFISFEMADMLRQAGLEVTVIIRESHFWEPTLDKTSAEMVENVLQKGGVKIIRGREIKEIKGKDKAEAVILETGEEISCDLVLAGVGSFCPYFWAETAGIKVNRGILANEFLETGAPDIWVAGDAAEFKDLILNETLQLGNWVNAQMQGRRAALNMLGQKEPFRLVSFYSTQGFGVTLAFVGDVRVSENREIIGRGPAKNFYIRLILRNNKIIGATILNKTAELAPISKLIEKQTDISAHLDKLADLDFDLRSILKL